MLDDLSFRHGPIRALLPHAIFQDVRSRDLRRETVAYVPPLWQADIIGLEQVAHGIGKVRHHVGPDGSRRCCTVELTLADLEIKTIDQELNSSADRMQSVVIGLAGGRCQFTDIGRMRHESEHGIGRSSLGLV